VGPVIRAASGGVTHRLARTVVILVVLTASTAATLLGLALLTSANELFFNAFAAQRRTDLAVPISSAGTLAGTVSRRTRPTRPARAYNGAPNPRKRCRCLPAPSGTCHAQRQDPADEPQTNDL
jgi:hypothetical protein